MNTGQPHDAVAGPNASLRTPFRAPPAPAAALMPRVKPTLHMATPQLGLPADAIGQVEQNSAATLREAGKGSAK
jgi:hypothetical protein